MANKSVSLLSQPKFFQRYQKRLPKLILRAVKEILGEDADTDAEEVYERIVQRFELVPLEIGPLHAISLEVEPRWYLSTYEVPGHAYHAEAIVGYQGSKALWSARPNDAFDWRMRGVIQEQQVRIQVLQDTKDWDGLERLMEKELAEARKALNAFLPNVIMFNLHNTPLMGPLVSKYVERLRGQDLQQDEDNQADEG